MDHPDVNFLIAIPKEVKKMSKFERVELFSDVELDYAEIGGCNGLAFDINETEGTIELMGGEQEDFDEPSHPVLGKYEFYDVNCFNIVKNALRTIDEALLLDAELRDEKDCDDWFVGTCAHDNPDDEDDDWEDDEDEDEDLEE